MSQAFRFRHFLVFDDKSSMKVGTDSILLGAWAQPPASGEILDMGSGSGVLVLMLAQKTEATITAVDKHTPSVKQAAENFKISPWATRLRAIEADFFDLSFQLNGPFDYIISNPPFFINSLKPQEFNKLIAKHAGDAFVERFVEKAEQLLHPAGKLCCIFPVSLEGLFVKKAAEAGLYLQRKANVSGKANLPVNRVITEFGKIQQRVITDEIIIRNLDNSFTSDYLDLTKEYHFFSRK
jgi:tRNA1Val (adenine37-N6)-methyltransferase